MTTNQILDQLKTLSDKSTLTYNTKHGVGENQFGVKLGIYKDYPVSRAASPLSLRFG